MEFEEKGLSPTAALICKLITPIHHTGKVVTFDGGLCVKVGIEALYVHGVYGQVLIKKKRYWPRGVPGDHIDQEMLENRICEVDSIPCAPQRLHRTRRHSSDQEHTLCKWRKYTGAWNSAKRTWSKVATPYLK